MKLSRFSVTNYRSIVKTPTIEVSDTTVLLGRNNEGKSNILAALTAAMNVVNQLAVAPLIQGRVHFGMGSRKVYQWDRDFPVALQEQRPDGESVVRLDFSLSQPERDQFKQTIGSNVNDTLPVEVHFGQGPPAFRVVKQGKGSKGLNTKAPQIARFIGDRIAFTYIPAVRTSDATLEVVQSMVRRELAELQKNDKYRKALEQIQTIQRPVLKAIGQRIQTALQDFIPRIQDVDITLKEELGTYYGRRSVDVLVDDGTVTSLFAKGDGVQSLAAIGLLRGFSPQGKELVLALEEPESHLHPGAIHQLRDLIYSLGQEHQVVLTTHCPLFVDRNVMKANIVVSESKAVPARSIAEIREVLGVRTSDNLSHATHVLVLEGATDARMLSAILRSRSSKLARALGHTLAIDHTGGAGNLSYKLTQLANAMCSAHCYFDHDSAANDAIAKAESQNLLKPADVHQVICNGMPESEIEDILKPSVYEAQVGATFGVRLQVKEFRNNKKWSDRMRQVFLSQGKRWTASIEQQLKEVVAEAAASSPDDCLLEAKRSSIDALVSTLEDKIARLRPAV
jgi:putative ATP-dependent endonuclease of OLD family